MPFFLFESYIASFNMFWVKITMLDKDVFDFQIELYWVQMDLIIYLKNRNSLNEVDSNFGTPQTLYYSRTLHFPWQQNYKLSIRFDSIKFFIPMNFWKTWNEIEKLSSFFLILSLLSSFEFNFILLVEPTILNRTWHMSLQTWRILWFQISSETICSNFILLLLWTVECSHH